MLILYQKFIQNIRVMYCTQNAAEYYKDAGEPYFPDRQYHTCMLYLIVTVAIRISKEKAEHYHFNISYVTRKYPK